MAKVEVRDPKVEKAGLVVDALAHLLYDIEVLMILPEKRSVGEHEQARNVFRQWRRLQALLGIDTCHNEADVKQEASRSFSTPSSRRGKWNRRQ